MDNQQAYFVVSASGPYQTIDALKAGYDMKIAAGSASGFNTLASLTVIDILDLDATVITGFTNDAVRGLATQRGEVIGYSVNIAAVKAELDAGTLKPLFVIATKRDPMKPDVPAITELVHLSEEDLALVELWEYNLSSSTILAAPAGIPKNRYAYLCNFAARWCQDESFRQEINRIVGYQVSYYASGEMLDKSIGDITVTLESFQTRFAELIEIYRK